MDEEKGEVKSVVRGSIKVIERREGLTRGLPESGVAIEGFNSLRQKKLVVAFDVDETLVFDSVVYGGDEGTT